MILERDKNAFRASISIAVEVPDSSGTQTKFSHSISLSELTADSMHELAKPENAKKVTDMISGIPDDLLNQLSNDPRHSAKGLENPAIQKGVKVMIERFVKATVGTYPENIERLILLFPESEKAFESKKIAAQTGLTLNHTALTRTGKKKDSESNKERDLKSYYDELGIQKK
jgi:hypothetical protein